MGPCYSYTKLLNNTHDGVTDQTQLGPLGTSPFTYDYIGLVRPHKPYAAVFQLATFFLSTELILFGWVSVYEVD